MHEMYYLPKKTCDRDELMLFTLFLFRLCRETFDPSLKSKAAQDIGRAFPGKRHYPTSLVIVTWDQVGYYDSQYHPVCRL